MTVTQISISIWLRLSDSSTIMFLKGFCIRCFIVDEFLFGEDGYNLEKFQEKVGNDHRSLVFFPFQWILNHNSNNLGIIRERYLHQRNQREKDRNEDVSDCKRIPGEKNHNSMDLEIIVIEEEYIINLRIRIQIFVGLNLIS